MLQSLRLISDSLQSIASLLMQLRDRTADNPIVLDDNERLLTSADVKRELQISSSTLLRLRRKNALVPVSIGGVPRFRESDVLRHREQLLAGITAPDGSPVAAGEEYEGDTATGKPDPGTAYGDLRVVNGAYALAAGILLAISRQQVLEAYSSITITSTGSMLKQVLIAGIFLYATLYTLAGAFFPRKSNLRLLMLLGKICRQAWLIIVVFFGASWFTSLKLPAYEWWNVVLVSLFITGFGLYTVAVVKKIQVPEGQKDS